MKILSRNIVIILALSFVAFSNAAIDRAKLEENPLLLKNKALADFGVIVASKSLGYAKSVRREGGVVVVDVVILDKLCHVTVDEGSDMFKAKAIECVAGLHGKSKPPAAVSISSQSDIAGESSLSKYGQVMVQTMSEALLQANLDIACAKEINERDQAIIANKSECSAEADQQIAAIADIPKLSAYQVQIKNFIVQNKLR